MPIKQLFLRPLVPPFKRPLGILSPWIYLFPIFHVNGTISRNMFSRVTHVVACVRILFLFMAQKESTLQKANHFSPIHSLKRLPLFGYCQQGCGKHGCPRICLNPSSQFSGIKPGVEWLAYVVTSRLLSNCWAISTAVAPMTSPLVR